MDQRQLLKRSISGVVFVIILVSCIWLSPWTLAGLFWLLGLVGITEMLNLLGKDSRSTNIIAYLGGTLVYATLILPDNLQMEDFFKTLLWLLIPLIMIAQLFTSKRRVIPAINTIFSWIYILIPFALLVRLSHLNGIFEPEWVLAYFFLIWTNDTGAYLVGSLIGKHKLAPSISPGKTWQGFIGGILLTVIVGYLIHMWLTDISLINWTVIALIVSIFGTMGDLVESQMKRNAGVKDSGNLMPGHGGVLDRFDGVFISLPLVYFYIDLFILNA